MRKVMAALLVAVGVLTLPAVHSASAEDAPVTLRSLGNGDTDVRGMYGATSIFVPIPPGTAVSGPVALDIEFSHSQLLRPDLSTLTVRVNNVSLASTFLTADNRSHGHLVVPVPKEIVGSQGLFVETRFFMRLTRDTCEEPTNPALWATVHGSSLITLPTVFAGPRDLSEVPRLVIPASVSAKPLAVVLASHPNDTLLQAAGVVAATAGGWLGAAGRDAVVTTATEAPTDSPSIQLGIDLPVPDASKTDAKNGVIAVDQSGPVRVIVTGPTAAAVLHAARGLRYVDQFSGPAVVLGATYPAAEPERSPPWTASAASFKQLGIGRQEVAGPGTKTFNFVIERPAGWKIDHAGRIDIDMDTAPGVRRGPSFVEATVNGFAVGTRGLIPGRKRAYRFDVPGGLIDRDVRGRPVRSLRLQLRVHLFPDQRTCTPLDAEATHASVLPTSSVTLSHRSGAGLDLGRFPSSLGNPLVVVRSNDDVSVAAALQAVATLGRWAPAHQRTDVATVVTTSELSLPRRRVNNLVLLGDAAKILDRSIAIDSTPVAKGAATAVAYASLGASPFNASKSALIVTGEGAGVIATMRALGSLEGAESIAGNVVAVLSDTPKAQVLKAETGAAPPVELAPILKKKAVRSETVVGAALLAAFLVSILLLIRFRWRSPRS